MTRFPEPARWEGTRVLVTGNTGFKGAWLTFWLEHMGAQVLGLSLPEPPTTPSLWAEMGEERTRTIRADLRHESWQAEVAAFQPQVVFHLAAQSIVAVGYREPRLTFDVNVLGTARLLEALGEQDVAALVVVTTDKVYDPRQAGPFAEDAFLGGLDPYAASKAATELLCGSWPTPGLPMVTARAGNVVGGGDWSPDRLVPDLVRSWTRGQPLLLRDPTGIRPWQHVLEPLRGYLVYAEELMAGHAVPPSLNFGPAGADMTAVRDLVAYAAGLWARWATGGAPQWQVAESRPYAETGVLTIESGRAADALDWRGLLSWQETIRLTLEWYLDRERGRAPRDLVRRDLEAYLARSGKEQGAL